MVIVSVIGKATSGSPPITMTLTIFLNGRAYKKVYTDVELNREYKYALYVSEYGSYVAQGYMKLENPIGSKEYYTDKVSFKISPPEPPKFDIVSLSASYVGDTRVDVKIKIANKGGSFGHYTLEGQCIRDGKVLARFRWTEGLRAGEVRERTQTLYLSSGSWTIRVKITNLATGKVDDTASTSVTVP